MTAMLQWLADNDMSQALNVLVGLVGLVVFRRCLVWGDAARAMEKAIESEWRTSYHLRELEQKAAEFNRKVALAESHVAAWQEQHGAAPQPPPPPQHERAISLTGGIGS